MKLRYFSDLHLEFIKPNKIQKFIDELQLVNNTEKLKESEVF